MRGLHVVLSVLTGLCSATAGAQDRPQALEREVGLALQSAPVKIANRFIVDLRGPIAGYSAAERARTTVQRIEAVLDSGAEPAVTTEAAEEGKATRVKVAGQHAFLITQIDLNLQAGETTQLVAREAALRLEKAIGEWREQHAPRYLLEASLLAVAATLLIGAFFWVLLRANRWIGGRLAAAAAAHAEKLRVDGVRLLDTSHVLNFTRRAIALFAWVVALSVAAGWLTFVFDRFPYTRPWAEGMEGNLLGLLKLVALAIAEAAPGLLLVAVIVVLARFFVRALAVFFDQIESGRVTVSWLDADTVHPTRRIFNFAVWVFALAMAYPYLPGAQTDAFKGLSVLVGVMVTVGGASVVGQAFSGLILMYVKAFRKGDFVRIGENEGTVVEVGMFATKIRTGLGEEVTLPNSGIMATTTKNYSRAVPGTGYVIDTGVTIGYSTPWRQVEAMLLEAAKRTPDIAKNISPIVRQTALSDYYVEYRLVAYTPAEHPAVRVDVLNRLHGHIQDVFNEFGVQIMSPHYMGDPSAPLVVPKDQWYAAPARPPGKQVE
ncbi:MAG TPA: mechanosensitive ion channel family protein [Burkholderiales bacterium]